MLDQFDTTDRSLLDDFQRDFPRVPCPFAEMGERLGIAEDEVIARLVAHQKDGLISRVGATVRPNTAGASTLAALAVPENRIEAVAAQVGAQVGVNHSYLREHHWNLWFVATAPDADRLQASLNAIRAETGLTLLDLRLVRPFNIDLGFPLAGGQHRARSRRAADLSQLRESDRPLLHALSQGLPLTACPYAALGQALGWTEGQVIARIEALLAAGILTRLGVIVRHRAVGWSANAMVVWDVRPDCMDFAGPALAALPGVTLCYQRRTVPGLWRYALFSMIHARSRADALEVLGHAKALRELRGVEHEVLFSTRCFKQTGAQLAAPGADKVA